MSGRGVVSPVAEATRSVGEGRETRLHTRRARTSDREAIERLGEEIFRTRRSAALWRWHFERTPGGAATVFVLEDAGVVVGHHAHSPFEVWVDGARVDLALSHELMIDPAYRGRGGTGVLVRAFADENAFDLRIGFPYEHAAVLLERLGVGRSLGRFPRWVHALPQERPRLSVRGLARTLAQTYSEGVSRYRGALAFERVRAPGSEFDELARNSAGFARCVRIRDAAYLRWRWLEEPDTQTRLVAARDAGGDLRGFVACDVGIEDGVRFGRVLDLLATDLTATRALLAYAARALAALGAERIECFYHDPRWWSRAALVLAGYLPARPTINVFCGTYGSRAGQAPLSLRSWYLTQGDIDFDATAAQPGRLTSGDNTQRAVAAPGQQCERARSGIGHQ